MQHVKRPYDTTRRRAQAEQNRQAILATARVMLLSEGYHATTIPMVARACAVSVGSVYKRYQGKPALVRAVVEDALQGAGPLPAEARSDALPVDDLDELLRNWGQLAVEISPRAAPLLLLVRTAALQDDAVAALDRELSSSRRDRMTSNAQRLADAGHLSPDGTVAQAADVLWTYTSPELYELLVLRSGWPLPRYGTFVTQGLAAHLRQSE